MTMRTKFVPGKINYAHEAYILMTEGKLLKYDGKIMRYDAHLQAFVSKAPGEAAQMLSTLSTVLFGKIQIYAELTWEDDVSNSKPCVCWVSNSSPTMKSAAAVIHTIDDALIKTYGAVDGEYWKFATPLTLEDCWSGEIDRSQQ